MFYIFILDQFRDLVFETEEVDFNSFMLRCHNFCQTGSLENLHVSYVGPDDCLYHIPTVGMEKMLQYWISSTILKRKIHYKFH